MRRAAKIDANHAEIVRGLRAVGASVQSLAAVGKGCPDLAVGFRGFNRLVEIKDGKNGLTPDQQEWFARWKGTVHVVHSVQEALDLIGATDSCAGGK